MPISLCRAAGEVTGSGYQTETTRAQVLVDFGKFLGQGMTEARNRSQGLRHLWALDAVLLTHALLDHSGRLPLLWSGDFRRRIRARPATIDLVGRVGEAFDAIAIPVHSHLCVASPPRRSSRGLASRAWRRGRGRVPPARYSHWPRIHL